VRDRVRDPVGEEAPRQDHDPERGPDGPGAGKRTRVRRTTRGDVPHARRALRGKIREDPEHRGHGRGRGEGIRPAGPRGLLGMAAHPVRVRSDAGPDRPPHGHPDADGPKGPPKGGTVTASESLADPCGPARATGIDWPNDDRCSGPRVRITGLRTRSRTGRPTDSTVHTSDTFGRSRSQPEAPVACTSGRRWG